MLHHTFWRGNQILKVALYLLKRKSNSEGGTIPSEEEIKFWMWDHTFWRGNQILKMAPNLLKRKSNSEDGTIPSEEEIKFWRWRHTFWRGNQILKVVPYLLRRKSNSDGGTIPFEEEIKFWRWHHTFWWGNQILKVAPYLVGLNVEVGLIVEFQFHKLHRVQGVVGAVAQGDKGGVLHCHDPQQVTRFTPRSPEQHTLIHIGGWTTWDSITRTYVLVVQQHGTVVHGHTYWWFNNMGHYYTDIRIGGWTTWDTITRTYILVVEQHGTV